DTLGSHNFARNWRVNDNWFQTPNILSLQTQPQNTAPAQSPAFDLKKPECLPDDIKNKLREIYARTKSADAAQRPQEFAFQASWDGSAITSGDIVPGEVNQHFVNMGDIRTSTFFAAHSHGEFDEVGASTGTKPPSDVSEVQRMHELG